MTITTRDRAVQTTRADANGPRKARTDAELRAQIAQWAIKQANDPNVGYSQAGDKRYGQAHGKGHRYYDCSGLVYSAYKAFGIKLGGNRTAAMWNNHSQWADTIPKNVKMMKPGDLILMDGHVVMYTGHGRVVSAGSNFTNNPVGTSNINFKDQVRSNLDVNMYLSRSDSIVLRPRISDAQLSQAPASPPLSTPTGSVVHASSSGRGRTSRTFNGPGFPPTDYAVNPSAVASFFLLLEVLNLIDSGDPAAAEQVLATGFPGASPEQLQQVVALLQSNPAVREAAQRDPQLLEKLVSSPGSVDELLKAAGTGPTTIAEAAPPGDSYAVPPDVAPVALSSQADALQVDPSTLDPVLLDDLRARQGEKIPV